MTKTVTVTKRVPLKGNCFFEVRVNGEIHSSFSFKIEAATDDIYNEETNRLAALELAKKLENGEEETSEIIYQTPKN